MDDNDRFLPVKDKVVGRRIRVAKLHSKGWTQTEISKKVEASLSTIEKDIKFLKDNGKWVFSGNYNEKFWEGVKKW